MPPLGEPTGRRLRQGFAALHGGGRGGDGRLPASLTVAPRTARLFAALAPHDRRHLVAVHGACVSEGLSPDLVLAGLLHDVGKSSLSARRITLLDRTLHVLLGRVTPRPLVWLAREPTGGATLGLHLALHHPALGAGRLAALGWPASVTDLVRRHATDDTSGDLAVLRRIDDATP